MLLELRDGYRLECVGSGKCGEVVWDLVKLGIEVAGLPDSYFLSAAYAAKGDKEKALASLQKTLNLVTRESNNSFGTTSSNWVQFLPHVRARARRLAAPHLPKPLVGLSR
jgi:hypothetical protein